MYIRLTTILLAIFVAGLPSLAEWDSRFFPTHEKPVRVYQGTNLFFQADVVMSQMWYAVEERLWAGSKVPSGEDYLNYMPIRNQEAILAEAKSQIKGIIPSFIDSLFYSNDVSQINITNLKYYTEIELLNQLSLPGDFFVNTPVRNLMGNQQFHTNNAVYGWESLRLILQNLKWTLESGGILKYGNNETRQRGILIPVTPEVGYALLDDPPVPGYSNIENYFFVSPVISPQLLGMNYYKISATYGENYNYGKAYIPDGCLEYVFGEQQSDITDHTKYSVTKDLGWIAAATRQPVDSLLYLRNHNAYTYASELSFVYYQGEYDGRDGDQDDIGPLPISCNKDESYYLGEITQNITSIDGERFVVGQQFNAGDVGCTVSQIVGPLDPGNYLGDISEDCPGDINASYPQGDVLRARVSKTVSIKHIIQWDYQFK